MSEDRIAVLEERLAAVERAVAELRAAARPPAAAPGPRKDPLEGHPLIWKKPPPEELAKLEAEVDRALGIEGVEPVGIEELHKMFIADGIDPNDNEFSRGIIEEREERG
ncbi:MAG TPA: hypothetical protein VGF55_26155 [Gemmataceae bacterium]|jgi:hypothetical protein